MIVDGGGGNVMGSIEKAIENGNVKVRMVAGVVVLSPGGEFWR